MLCSGTPAAAESLLKDMKLSGVVEMWCDTSRGARAYKQLGLIFADAQQMKLNNMTCGKCCNATAIACKAMCCSCRCPLINAGHPNQLGGLFALGPGDADLVNALPIIETTLVGTQTNARGNPHLTYRLREEGPGLPDPDAPGLLDAVARLMAVVHGGAK